MTIKFLSSFFVAAAAVASSAIAAVEWIDCPAPAELRSCEPARSRGALVVVLPRPGGQFAVGASSLTARPPQVVVITPQGTLTAD